MKFGRDALGLIRKDLSENFKPSGLLTAIGMMAITTVLAFVFRMIGIGDANVIMLYILGVLLVSIQSGAYFNGIFASILGVLLFNFFFVEPLYTFQIHSSEYIVTFVVMLIVALITSALTSKVKLEADLAGMRERRSELLYNVSRNLLTTHSIDQIVATAAVNIAAACAGDVAVYMADEGGNLCEPYVYSAGGGDGMKTLTSAGENARVKAVFEGSLPDAGKVYYVRIEGRNRALGVIGVCLASGHPEQEQKALIDAIAIQTALTIERESYSKLQRQSDLEAQSERLRSNLLRAVSHDLKTPLAGIVGSASTLLDSGEKLDSESEHTLLGGIYEDAQWLSNSVDNILSITRIEDGRVEVKKSMEAAEEIVGESVARVRRYAGRRTVTTEIPPELLLIPMDGRLIEQVLVNLLDNAVKYTAEESVIRVRVYKKDKNAVFEVSDNGPGIAEKDLPLIFDRFYTGSGSLTAARKGIGLGLAICRSIVTAHHGTISAQNGKNGGAVFCFALPLEE